MIVFVKILVWIELNFDVNRVTNPVQHFGCHLVICHPQIDSTDLQQLVTHLEAGLVREAVAGDGGHEHTSGSGVTTGAGAGLTRKLLDLDAELLAALLNMDRPNLPRERFVALMVGAGAVAGAEGAARRQNFYVVRGGKGGTTG